MKYPVEQYNELKNGLKKLQSYLDLKESNIHTLHYVVFQQYSEGQEHNALYIKDSELLKAFQVWNKYAVYLPGQPEENRKGWEKFITSEFDFKLYPEGCNDNHIETAVKKAVKELTQ